MDSTIVILVLVFLVVAVLILINNLSKWPKATDPTSKEPLYNAEQDRQALEYEVATQVIYFLERVCAELAMDMRECKTLGELYRHRKITYWTTGQAHFTSASSPETVDDIIHDPQPFSRALRAMVEAEDLAPGAVIRLPRDLKRKILEYRPWSQPAC